MGIGELLGAGDPSPIRIEGRPPTVLAIHGFGGTPLEIALATEVAENRGLAAHAPLLPGHGTHARDLAPMRWRDWVTHVEEAFDEARARGPVIVVGLSLGSLLATHLAVERAEQTAGLALLANAFWLSWPFPRIALEWADRLRLPDFSIPKSSSDLGDPETRNTHMTYSAQPVHAAIDVMRAGERMRARLTDVRCPTLIAHGRRDRVCPASSVHRVAGLLGSTKVVVLELQRSRHIVTRDFDRKILAGALERFFVECAPTGQVPVDP